MIEQIEVKTNPNPKDQNKLKIQKFEENWFKKISKIKVIRNTLELIMYTVIVHMFNSKSSMVQTVLRKEGRKAGLGWAGLIIN